MDNDIALILESYKSTSRSQLLPILQDIQEEIGFLPEEAMIMVGKHLKIPATKVYGVATFYNNFRFKAKGIHHVRICNGSNCHLENSLDLITEINKLLNISHGETTADGKFSLEIVTCLGGCAQSPVIEIDGRYYTKVTVSKLVEIISNLKNLEG